MNACLEEATEIGIWSLNQGHCFSSFDRLSGKENRAFRAVQRGLMQLFLNYVNLAGFLLTFSNEGQYIRTRKSVNTFSMIKRFSFKVVKS